MKPERWQQVESIFNAVLEREPHERALFLDQACGDDSWLREKIETLIRSDEGAGSFLEAPASAGRAYQPAVPVPGQFVGRSLGQYELNMHLGSGGMGDVYRARDTRLKRDVAIKILPPEFSNDPDRVARFQREAVALAALNHTNIAAIYDFEEITGTRFLVLELVEGETLATHLKRGPLSVDRAIDICRQVAEGLEVAHAKGIHHRDLKPANIQITSDDRVKLLDFGLAKVFAPEGEGKDSLDFPNITQWNTGPGVILGTAAYMSPEQARGHKPDKRSDIWAFGCVLFEALTGKQAFHGETITDVLAAVLKSEPDWMLLPPELSSSVQLLLQRCLRKEPKDRLHDIVDARIALEDAIAERNRTALTPPSPSRSSFLLTVAAVAIVAAGLAAAVTWRLRAPVFDQQSLNPTTRFSLSLPQSQAMERTLQRVIAISGDGSNVVYGSNGQLYLRRMSSVDAYPVSGSSGALAPTFSPDGRWLAFWSREERALKKLALDSGVQMTLVKLPVVPSSLSWVGNTIAFAAPEIGILAVSADGGQPEVWAQQGPGEIADSPQILDGGNAVLFSLTRETGMDRWDKGDIVLLSRKTGERKVLIHGGSDARYVPTGHIVYVIADKLFAVPFDLKRQQTGGASVPILEGVLHRLWPVSMWPFGIAQFAFSLDGTFIYVPAQTTEPAPPNREIRVVSNWFDELKRRAQSR